MINQLRTEACSGAIEDLAHVVSEDCLADCLTKNSAKPDALVKAVKTGILKNVDKHQPFRELMKDRHKAFYALEAWMIRNLREVDKVTTFMSIRVKESVYACLQFL